jgi:hypothetical protein
VVITKVRTPRFKKSPCGCLGRRRQSDRRSRRKPCELRHRRPLRIAGDHGQEFGRDLVTADTGQPRRAIGRASRSARHDPPKAASGGPSRNRRDGSDSSTASADRSAACSNHPQPRLCPSHVIDGAEPDLAGEIPPPAVRGAQRPSVPCCHVEVGSGWHRRPV